MSERPFYGSFAWAYDLLADRPVERECAWLTAVLAARGVAAGARLLDAGCATGRYALAMAGHGYRVTGLDRSLELLELTRRRGVSCIAADLTALPARRVFGAVLCRGVLNDVLEDGARRAALRGFADSMPEGGVLILDVRDWETTVRRRTADPVHERTVDTGRGRLTFRSETRLDAATHRMLIGERHVLATARGTQTAAHDFVMRCWTRDELEAHLTEAGLVPIDWRSAYEDDAPPGGTDRIVAVALRAAGMLKP